MDLNFYGRPMHFLGKEKEENFITIFRCKKTLRRKNSTPPFFLSKKSTSIPLSLLKKIKRTEGSPRKD